MRTLWQDLRYGFRLLLKRPGFTAVAVLTLALGIGANTAVFSFINSLLLAPLPVAAPDRLVRIHGARDGGGFKNFSYPNYADLRDRSRTLAGVAAHQYTEVSLNTGGGAENAQGEVVTGNYFAVLGAGAALGRALGPEDDVSPGAHPVVVISHGMWQRRFGADPSVVGRTIHLNGQPFTVVGVMPEKFRGTYAAFAAEFWAPMAMQGQVRPRNLSHLESRDWNWLSGTARLRDGVSIEQARAEARAVSEQLQKEHPDDNQRFGYSLVEASALPEGMRGGASRLLGFFMAVVGLVLLAACANIASILLSKVAARRQEVAVRQSLGATRARLARQWLTESLLLAALGGAAGLVVAVWVGDAMLSLSPAAFTNVSPEPQLDLRVLAFASLLTLLTGVLCGLFPALRASRAEVSAALKEGGVNASAGMRRSRLQQAFVVAQIAVSLLLLVVAGLLLRSLRESQSFNPGFDTDNLLLARFDLKRNGYGEAQGRAFYEQLTERLRSLPGVRAVTLASTVPLGPDQEVRSVRIPGHEPPKGKPAFTIDINVVGPGYFEAMGIALVRGRGFDRGDGAPGARPVAVINETMARRFWPGRDPVGQTVEMSRAGPPVEIVGVARDIKYYSLGEQPQPFLYGSFPQTYQPEMAVHVRTAGDPRALLRAVRKEAEALDPNVAVSSLTTFAELRRAALSTGRAMAVASGFFGLLALALAAVGLYGVMSYSVSQRTREIGIRVALGAQAGDVLRLVVGQGLLLALAGIAVGLFASYALTRLLASQLFGVSASDPATFAAVALLLAAVALLACYLPARRATKMDPMVALRYE